MRDRNGEKTKVKKIYKRPKELTSLFCVLSVYLMSSWAAILPVWAEGDKNYELSNRGKGEKEVLMADTDRLTDQEGVYLLSMARKAIEKRLFTQNDEDQGDPDLSPRYSERRGTFVTLTINEGLRGCIGHIIPGESLIEGIRINAINAAFRDPRFSPLSKEEWGDVKVEISILTEPKELQYSDADDLLNKLRPDIDGVIIKKGFRQATFLPQVWEQLPDKKEFLTHLCMKAGLDGHAWKKERIEVSLYQVQAFEEH